MGESDIAIIASGLSLVGTLINMWLKLQIRLEVLEMRQEILDEVDRKYVRLPRSIAEARVEGPR